MSETKKIKSDTPGKLGQSFSQPLLCGVFCFLFWFLLFILTDIYVSRPLDFGSREITALGIFRSRLLHADFSAYTFDTGMGMSFSRLLLGGFGGILSIPASLLPAKIYPQVMAFLSAIRLAAGAAFFFHLIRTAKAGFSTVISHILSISYSIAAFLICLLLRFPVADTIFLLPIVLTVLLSRSQKHTGRPSAQESSSSGRDAHGKDADADTSELSLSYLVLLCALLIASVAWDVIVIPILAASFLLLRKRGNKTLLLQSVLALGLCAVILIPQFMQMPYAMGRGEPSVYFLRELGSDTSIYRSDVTFDCEATNLLLKTTPSLFVVAPQHVSENSGETIPLRPTDFSSHFSFLNEWFYTLWPSLPILPFQDTSSEDPVYIDPNTVSSTVTTLFMDPLYCAVWLPNRSHPVEVFLNDRSIATVSDNSNPVLLPLGQYNVGQTLTLKITSSHAEDLKEARIQFGHLNSLNWSTYTDNSNYGISSITRDADGITAEGLISFESTLLTNIPYEDGWSLYLNGQKVKLSSYREAWLCADVTAGSYVIHLHYTSPGTTLGGWISGLSFLGLSLYFMLQNRKKTSPQA